MNILFGANVDPHFADPQEPIRRAQLVERLEYDMLTIQDHPYNNSYYDTWTLKTAIGMKTERIRIGTNVSNLPLRPPAMLAKQAASLDVLTGGRVDVGLGAGAFWPGIKAMGGPDWESKTAYRAFKDALHILRGFWENAGGGSFSYEGSVLSVKGMKPGPKPAHHIPIWTGAYGPSMLKLTGRMADGILVSMNYLGPDKLDWMHGKINEGAESAGRNPSEIRRGYNLMGVVDVGLPETKIKEEKEGFIMGSPEVWVDEIIMLVKDKSMDTFIFWPAGEGKYAQLEGFAQEVIPAVREAIG